MAESTLRPTANGPFNAWPPLGAKAAWEELAQELLDPGGAPLTSRGIKSPAETAKRQTINFTLPTLTAGQRITGLVVHVNGKWTAKLKVNTVPASPTFAVEGEIESSASGSGWAGAAGWTKILGAGSSFPWSPYTQAQLEEKAGTGERGLSVTFNTGKASVQEIYEVYIVVTVEGGGEAHQIVLAFDGTSTFTAKPNAPLNLRATFAGVGAVTDRPNTPRQLAAVFPGVGSLLAAVKTPRQLRAVFAGSGTMAAVANTPRKLAAAFAGVGDLAARVTVPQKLRAAFAGVGGLLATVTAFKSVTAQRTPTRFTITNAATRASAGIPSRVTLDGAAARLTITNPPARIGLNPHTTKVVT